jgi:hypothetical protein
MPVRNCFKVMPLIILKGEGPRLEESSDQQRGFRLGGVRSVANLDAGSIPNAPIPIPHGGAARPIACRSYVDGSRRIIPGAARYRGSKQRTHRQAADNAGRYLATPCERSPRCTSQTKAAYDQQTDQKLSHVVPLRMKHHYLRCISLLGLG